MKASTVGVIGLGIIGSRIAKCLRNAGIHVYVWNRSAKPEPNFLAGPAEMASLTNTIEIFVRNGTDLLEVLTAMQPELTADHVVVNHSTVDPVSTRDAAALVEKSGGSYLDCPFTGSKEAAAGGQLVYYAAGDESALERVRTLLEISSKEIIPTGTLGTATVLKIATNMISSITVQALSEALKVVRASGISEESFQSAMASNACNSLLAQMKLPTIAEGNFDPHFSLVNMNKDANLGLGIAEKAQIQLPALTATAAAMQKRIDKGEGEQDYSILASNS